MKAKITIIGLLIGITGLMAMATPPSGGCQWSDPYGNTHRVYKQGAEWRYQSPGGTQVITQAYAMHLCAMQ